MNPNDGIMVVCLLTYKRLSYAEKTLRSTLEKLHTSVPVAVHIADDGSGNGHIERLRAVAREYPCVRALNHSDSARGGYGKNYNLATQAYHMYARWALVLEDDWELLHDFHIDPLLQALDTDARIGCIRLGYLSFTQELRGTVLDAAGMKYLLLDPNSHEPHIFAGHPRVESIAWERELGAWPEGLYPGDTEFYVATKMPASRRRVVWPLDAVHPRGDLYAHIGSERVWD